jgi:hypothetical protein
LKPQEERLASQKRKPSSEPDAADKGVKARAAEGVENEVVALKPTPIDAAKDSPKEKGPTGPAVRAKKDWGRDDFECFLL